METTFLNKISEIVDTEFNNIFAGLSGKQISKLTPEAINKKADRMKAEATAYIGLKSEMFKKMIKKLNEIE
mgnify:CR=1 FL=1|jgi:hypothetical protein